MGRKTESNPQMALQIRTEFIPHRHIVFTIDKIEYANLHSYLNVCYLFTNYNTNFSNDGHENKGLSNDGLASDNPLWIMENVQSLLNCTETQQWQ